jgi:hypothetical protein
MKTEIRIADEMDNDDYRKVAEMPAKIGCLFIAIVLLIVTIIIINAPW